MVLVSGERERVGAHCSEMATFIYKQFNTDITWLHFFHIDLQADHLHILRLAMNLSEEELFEGIIALLILAVAIFMVVITVITIITAAIFITIITSWHPH